MVGIWLVIEGCDLAEATPPVEGDRLIQGTVGLEPQHLDPCFPRQPLELLQQPASEPDPTSLRRDPHPLQLGWRTGMELEGSAADRLCASAGDEEDAGRRRHLVRGGGDAERGVEARLEACGELGEVLLEAPGRISRARILDGDTAPRMPEADARLPP